MPIPVICPNGHHMTLPDFQAGKRFRCPLCFTYLEVPQAGTPPSPPSPAASEAKTAPLPENTTAAAPTLPAKESASLTEETRLEEKNWRRVALGLGFHYARLVVFLLGILGFFSIALAEPFLDDLVIPIVLVMFLTVCFLLMAPTLGLIGSIFCLSVPKEAGARRLLVASLLFELGPFALTYFTFAGALQPAEEALGLKGRNIAFLGGLLFQLTSWFFFMLFLRQLALYLDQQVQADEVVQLLAKGFALLLIPPLIVLGSAWLMEVLVFLGCLLGPIMMALPFVVLVLYIMFLFQQLALIGALRQAICNRK
jgi:hypothetical protein